MPDLTLYLDVDEETGLQRARGRGELDRIEEEDIEFFRRTRTRYLELAKRDPNIVIINANQEMLNVHQAILRALEEHLF